ncbi:MAG: hypothetical protein JST68_23920, partial [Bacteroidetes bacterium]|nr:hypothetical protein [Bacteroidota bacterium]
MRKYFLTFLLCGIVAAAMAQSGATPGTARGSGAAAGSGADSTNFFLHKFAQNIGKETYWVKKTDSGYRYEVQFKFTDRGSAVPLQAKLSVNKNFEPLRFWIKGKTSRFSTISDSVVIRGGKAMIRVGDSSYTKAVGPMSFTVGGYSPGTVQMVLLQYWKRHGRPAQLSLLPTGSVKIRKAGNDTLGTVGLAGSAGAPAGVA